jgi:hypothetical protein
MAKGVDDIGTSGTSKCTVPKVVTPAGQVRGRNVSDRLSELCHSKYPSMGAGKGAFR